jgi:hypothetical protein
MFLFAVLLAQIDPSADLAAFARMILAAALSGNWPLLVVLALIGAVELFRRLAPWPWSKTRFAGWAALLLFSALGALGTALLAGGAFTWGLAATALGIGFTAAGGYQALKDFLPIVLQWLANRRAVSAPAPAPQPAPPPTGVAGVVPVTLDTSVFGRVSPEVEANFSAKMLADGYKWVDGQWKR